jgi:WD40-like Beta Propeller Repeat
MFRKLIPTLPLALLALAALACAIPGADAPASTPDLGAIQTQVAATLTAAAPAGVPSSTPAVAPTSAPTDVAPTEAVATEVPTAEVPPTVPAPTAQCFVAMGFLRTLLCQNGPDQIQVADVGEGHVIGSVEVSPDGGMVAYSVSANDGINELWVVSSDGTNAHKLLDKTNFTPVQPDTISFPQSFQWQAGTHTIYLDTGYQATGGFGGGPGEYANFDLWKVDVDTTALTQVLTPGSAGRFSLSPNGQWIAVTRPQDVSLISADGATVKPNLITFAPIITYSEYAYKPDVTWSTDSAFFTLAIPSADPLAADSNAALHRVNIDGSVQDLIVIPGNFVFGGGLSLSPDGQHVAYSTVDAANVYTLHVAGTTDGAGGSEIESGLVRIFGWSPDSLHFAFHVVNDGIYAGTLNLNPQQLAPQVPIIKDVAWSDVNNIVFTGTVNDHWGVRQATIGGNGAADIAGPFGQEIVFDVK